MEYALLKKFNLFVANAQAIKKEFRTHNTMTRRLVALLYAQDDKPIDCDAIRRCREMIKQNTGFFSMFRGHMSHMSLCVAAMLSLSGGSQVLFKETLKVYNLLRSVKFHNSDYLVVAAVEIAKRTKPEEYPNVIGRARAFYDGMRRDHIVLTGQDDYIFAALMGLSDINVAAGVKRIEELYRRFRGTFWDRNSVQALAQVLMIGSSDDEAADRVQDLREALRLRKLRLDKSYTLSSLGVLAILPADIDAIVDDVDEVYNALRLQKGFNRASVSKAECLLFAAALVVGKYAQNMRDGLLTATISTSFTSIIIAQQMALIAALSASSAAAAASASS